MEEIKAGDIMIGNYLMFESTTHIVTEISETLVVTRWIKGNDKYIHELSDLRPIPLTEGILLKSGFEKDVNGILWFQITPDRHFELIHSQGYYYPQLAQSPEMSCESINVVSLNRIKSVHQLQNLFFALTGGEIKIEL